MKLVNLHGGTLKSRLKRPDATFTIYNTKINKALDADAYVKILPPQGKRALLWHANFNPNQQFRFEVDQHQKNNDNSVLSGHFIPVSQPNTVLSVQNSRFVIVSSDQKYKSVFGLQMNDKGLISIKTIEQQQVRSTIKLNDPKAEEAVVVLDPPQSQEFQWIFMKKEGNRFNEKQVMILVQPEKTHALSSKTGERWVKKELLDIYEKQNHIFKAKCNSSCHYSFLQLYGDYYITARNEAAVFSPFSGKESEWTIIQNFFLDEIYYFLSMSNYYYLISKTDSTLNLSSSALDKQQQSFQIIFADDKDNNTENTYPQQIAQDDSISNRQQIQRQNNSSYQQSPYQYQQQNQKQYLEQSPLSYAGKQAIQSIPNQQLYDKKQNISNQNNQINQNLAQQAKLNLLNFDNKFQNLQQNQYNYNNKNQNNQNQLYNQQQQQQYQNGNNQLIKKYRIKNRGSENFLKVNEQEVIETPDSQNASLFTIIYQSQDLVHILFQDQPLGILNPSQVAPVRLIDRNLSQKNNLVTQLMRQPNGDFVIKKGTGAYQIIGGRLYISELQPNDYNIFNLSEVF